MVDMWLQLSVADQLSIAMQIAMCGISTDTIHQPNAGPQSTTLAQHWTNRGAGLICLLA